MATRRGLEPRMTGPKPVVLPITPPGSGIFVLKKVTFSDTVKVADLFWIRFYRGTLRSVNRSGKIPARLISSGDHSLQVPDQQRRPTLPVFIVWMEVLQRDPLTGHAVSFDDSGLILGFHPDGPAQMNLTDRKSVV